jgi:hypothetical protein
MLYFFNKTRYGTLVRVIVGIAILVLGVVGHARIAVVIGAVLIAWGLLSVVRRRRAGSDDGAR